MIKALHGFKFELLSCLFASSLSLVSTNLQLLLPTYSHFVYIALSPSLLPIPRLLFLHLLLLSFLPFS